MHVMNLEAKCSQCSYLLKMHVEIPMFWLKFWLKYVDTMMMKRKGFKFISGQSSKKSRSSDSSGNSLGSGFSSISSPQSFQTPQPSKLGTSPMSFAFKGR